MKAVKTSGRSPATLAPPKISRLQNQSDIQARCSRQLQQQNENIPQICKTMTNGNTRQQKRQYDMLQDLSAYALTLKILGRSGLGLEQI